MRVQTIGFKKIGLVLLLALLTFQVSCEPPQSSSQEESKEESAQEPQSGLKTSIELNGQKNRIQSCLKQAF